MFRPDDSVPEFEAVGNAFVFLDGELDALVGVELDVVVGIDLFEKGGGDFEDEALAGGGVWGESEDVFDEGGVRHVFTILPDQSCGSA